MGVGGEFIYVVIIYINIFIHDIHDYIRIISIHSDLLSTSIKPVNQGILQLMALPSS